MSMDIPATSYSKVADQYDSESNETSFWGEFARRAYEGFVLKPNHRLVVDVGCGTGLALHHLQGCAPESTRFIGVEPSELMRLRAQQRNRNAASVELREGSFEALPLADASVDYLYSIWAFHWSSDPRRASAEIRRVLKEDGDLDMWFIGLNTGREFASKTAEVLSRYVNLETRLRAASMMAAFDRNVVDELFSGFALPGLTITEETESHYDSLEAHWAWQIRSEAHFSVIPPEKREQFDAELRAALASLGDERGVPYTRHSFHVRYRHVERAIFAVPEWMDRARTLGPPDTTQRPVALCTLEADSAEHLRHGAQLLAGYVENASARELLLEDVRATVGASTREGLHRLALAAPSAQVLAQGLRVAAEGRIPALGARHVRERRPVVGFLFTGQGSARMGMGRELFKTCPAFRFGVEACARISDVLSGGSLVEVLCSEDDEPIEDSVQAQLALFALQYALAHLWRSWGVHPNVLVGHSLGEYAAACVAGVFSLEDAVALVFGRAQAMRDHARPGALCAVRSDAERLAPLLARRDGRVVISAFNAPESLVLAGEEGELEALRQSLAAEGIRTTPLQTAHAFHSPLMVPAEQPFRDVCALVRYAQAKIALVSTVVGGQEVDVSNPEYWVRHMLEPVQFSAAVETLAMRGVTACVEIGPGATLMNLVSQCLGDSAPLCVPSLNGPRDNWPSLVAGLGAIQAQGVAIDWERFAHAGAPRTVCLLIQGESAAEGVGTPQATGDSPGHSNTSPWARRLRELPLAARPREARRLVRQEVSGLLRRELSEDSDRAGLMELGFDSLRSVALARQLAHQMEQQVSDTLTFARPNVDALARFVLETLQLSEPTESTSRVAAEAPRNDASEPIAIVGVGCRLPGGVVDMEGLWRLLDGGRDAVGEFPKERWDVAEWLDADLDAPGKTCVTRGSFLDDVAGFEPSFFGISPREALRMDPAHRMLLEVCWEALEDASVAPRSLVGSRTGIFMGIGPSEYEGARPLASNSAVIDAYSGLGTMPSVGVGRISYALGLQGPCFAVDTACSSSLVAIHQACRSLRTGECTLALAGGVSLMLSPSTFVFLSKSHALSTDGRCKTFSADADGYGRGEGCAVIALKPLSRALADGDRILALIRGSAINHDGASSGLTVPNGAAQEEVIRQALRDANCEPTSVGYVEAHGTGTPLGDPIEVEALNAVYGQGRSAQEPMLLGSVKTNIGHLEYAAGIAGLLKTVLCLREGRIPAHLHSRELNPRVAWDALPMRVTREPTPWPQWNASRRAAVSSFGMSGTNAHVVLEEAPRAQEGASGTLARPQELVVLSARSASALDAMAARLGAHLDAHPRLGLDEVAFNLAVARSPLEHRLALPATSCEELRAALAVAAQGQTPVGAVRGRTSTAGVPKLVFVFPGQGSQWVGMGRRLLAQEPVFRAALDACEQAIQSEAGWSVLAELAADEATSRLERIDVVQPVLFALEVALAALWRSWGVEPDAVVGHSMGEVAAAHVAGALSLEDAVAIICRRSQLLRRIRGQGEMALVDLSRAETEAALRGYEDRLSVAVSNSPRSTVVAGSPEALAEVLAVLEARGVFCRRVKVDVASHSPQVEPLREELLAALGDLRPRATELSMRSTLTCASVAGEELVADYWADNLRLPVRFADTVQALLQDGYGLFIEMSPHPILTIPIEECRRDAERWGITVGSLRRGQDERSAMLESLGALWVQGYPVSWERLFPEGGRRVPLPTYPWQRERHWLELSSEGVSGSGRRAGAGAHPLLGDVQSLSTEVTTQLWETTLDLERLPWLGEHRVQGAAVLPGAAYLEMALSAGARHLGEGPVHVTDVVLEHALAFAGDTALSVQMVTTEEQPGRLRFQVASRALDAGRSPWRVHAHGMVRRVEQAEAPVGLDLPALRGRLAGAVPAATLYEALRGMGLEYGPSFQGLVELWRGQDEALGRVRLPQAAGSPAPYWLHPALLDACFHVLASALADGGDAMPWVPVEIGALRLFQRPSGELWCHMRDVSAGQLSPQRRAADLLIVDGTGARVAEVTGLVAQRLAGGARTVEQDRWFLELDWEAAVLPPGRTGAGRWLLLGDGGGLGPKLRSALEELGHAVFHATGRDTNIARVKALLAGSFGGRAPTAVVHLGSLETSGEPGPDILEAALVRGCDSVLAAVQALAEMGWRDAPRLWLLTRGAQAARAGAVSVAQAPLLGLARVIALEHAELRCIRVDLDAACPPGEHDIVLAELLADDAEEEVALRGGERLVARLRNRLPEAERKERLELAGDKPFRLELDRPGVLDDLVLHPLRPREPGPGEVQIAVDAAGLNFLDVLLALGMMPNDVAEASDAPLLLGGECAGRITLLGEGVTGLAVGQPVVALAQGAFASHLTLPATLVLPGPSGLSATDAAAMPVTYLTAWYALDQVAQLQPGERVLIHAATGGVGLAAVQWARHVGAEVYATAGTPEKRDYLRSLGVPFVSDSRSERFVADVRAWTGGEGVDVVLNSLSGELIGKSFELLRDHGRFVELGKRDYYANNRLGLKPFLRNLSFSLVDLRGMMLKQPARVRTLFQQVMEWVARGVFTPPPVSVSPISQAAEAFRKMAQAHHLGKIVLTLADPRAHVRVPADSGVTFRRDGSYLITGGLGGLGLKLAAWLADQGAGHLVLVGRSGAASPEQRAAVDALVARGTRVTVARADVADPARLAQVIAEVDASGMPLRGVIHAAGILEDGMVQQLDPARLRRVLAPKVLGAWNLHVLTREAPLDFFVLQSSVAGLLGSAGQGNYAAANTFLDALAHQRRAEGLPALSVDWGAFSEVGLAAAQENRGVRLASRGIRSLTPTEGLDALRRLLDSDRAQVGVVPLDLRQWVGFNQAAASSRTLSRLMAEQRAGGGLPTGDKQLLARLSSAEPGARAELMKEFLRTQVSQVLRLPESRLEADVPFSSLGMDSLMGLELRNRIEAALGIRVQATLLWTYPTVATLAIHLARGTGAAPAEQAGRLGATSAAKAEVEDMSQDELARMIDEKFEVLA
ncbi:type I polyketide synthase [Corallococcus terminator]|nr:type I polyketide synthase [Corallococcus terminator]